MRGIVLLCLSVLKVRPFTCSRVQDREIPDRPPTPTDPCGPGRSILPPFVDRGRGSEVGVGGLGPWRRVPVAAQVGCPNDSQVRLVGPLCLHFLPSEKYLLPVSVWCPSSPDLPYRSRSHDPTPTSSPVGGPPLRICELLLVSSKIPPSPCPVRRMSNGRSQILLGLS